MKKTFWLAWGLVVALVLAGCYPVTSTPPVAAVATEASTAAPEATPVVTEAVAPDETSAPPAGAEIIGVTWLWERFDDPAGTGGVEVPDPESYTLLFNADGTTAIQADCNQVIGTYTLDGSSLAIVLGPSTQAFCGEQSLDQQYLQQLANVAGYAVEEGKLKLNLQADAGTMTFGGGPVATAPQVEGLTITAEQVSLDSQGLSQEGQAVVVPATPYDESMPPAPTGLPEHSQVLFGVTDAQDRQPRDPVIYIIPAAAYATLWLDNANPAVANTLVAIDEVSYALPSPAPTAGYPALPVEQVGTAYNDLAVQVARIPATPDSATKDGYRFVGRWNQDANPVTNIGLQYVYQGYTNDGKYLVSVWYPVRTEALPDEVSQVPAEDMEAFGADPTAAIAAKAEELNGLTAADFEPNLEQLDAMVASLEIEGMRSKGLEGTEWLWVATSSAGQGEQVLEPDKYRLSFGQDGVLDVVADCVSATGSYVAEGGQSGSLKLELPELASTDCGPESQSSQLLESLPAFQDYWVRVAGNLLQLPMPAGGPVFLFGNVTE